MGNLHEQSFDEIWNGARAREVRAAVGSCARRCWMTGTAVPAMKRNLPRVAWWVARNKVRVTPAHRPRGAHRSPWVQGHSIQGWHGARGGGRRRAPSLQASRDCLRERRRMWIRLAQGCARDRAQGTRPQARWPSVPGAVLCARCTGSLDVVHVHASENGFVVPLLRLRYSVGHELTGRRTSARSGTGWPGDSSVRTSVSRRRDGRHGGRHEPGCRVAREVRTRGAAHPERCGSRAARRIWRERGLPAGACGLRRRATSCSRQRGWIRRRAATHCSRLWSRLARMCLSLSSGTWATRPATSSA